MLTPARTPMGMAALCIALALAGPLQAATRSRSQPPPADATSSDGQSGTSDGPYEQPRHPQPKASGFPWWVLVPVAGCVATNCLGGGKQAQAPGPSRQDLLRDGPRAPASWPVGAYPIFGFIRNDWPIVVDYRSEPDSITRLTVSVEGRPVWSARLPSGDHYQQIRYTGGDAPGSKVALFVVQSEARSASGPGEPLPVEVRGIGAGPRAVGSVAINQLAFAFSGRALGGDFARFGYVAEGDFNKVNMEILRFTPGRQNGRKVIDTAMVIEFRQGAVPAGPFGPRMWSGLDNRRKPSRGVHRLQVRGWEVEDDESWVSAISDSAVEVP